jgi:hypothetical protein
MTAAMAALTEDMKRHLAANSDALMCGPRTIDFSCPQFQRNVRLLVRILRWRGTLTETLRRARTAKQAAAQAAALARATLTRQRGMTARSRLPALLSRARRHRSARRAIQRTGRAGRKRRRRGSPDDPGDIARCSAGGAA